MKRKRKIFNRWKGFLFLLLWTLSVCGFAQNITVKGTITDTNGETLLGVSVKVQGTQTGTVTDVNGSFILHNVPLNAVLEASYVGMKTQVVNVDGRTTMNIVLKEDSEALEEVVVVGYGTQKKVTLTGSTTSIAGASLQQSSSVNLSQGVAGRLSGVIVNNRGGEPGNDDAVMLIRGRSTLGNNNPLIVIDGIVGRNAEFSRLSGDEIESVTVLKDASAAIYGSRSANGVILVTTKRGKKSAKPTIEFAYDLGLQQPTRLPEMADAVLYATAVNASNAINEEGPRYTVDDIEKYRDGSDPILYPNTDWYDAIIKPLSAQHKYGVSARGGSDRMAYFVSLNGQYQDGIYRKSATNYNQYNLRSNIDFNVAKWLKIGVDLSAREQHKNYSAFPSEDYGIFYVTRRADPTAAPYYPNGYLRAGRNNLNRL
jgi:TonB-linked SusC/RagA family outer membrane protein